MKYILNSAVITSPGDYSYRLISLDDAKKRLRVDQFESCIGYPETALALQKISGVHVPISRKTIVMEAGDEALIFRLVFPSGYRPDPAQKGNLGLEFIIKNCEIGLLTRVS